MAATHALRDEEDLLILSTPGRVLLLTSSPVPGGGMQTYHITLSAGWLHRG